MNLPVIIAGGGGHARVVLDILHAMSCDVIGYVAPQASPAEFMGIPYMGGDDAVTNYSPEEVLIANGVGSVKQAILRTTVYCRFKQLGYRFVTLVHPSAVVSRSSSLGEGSQVMAGVVIQPEVQCAENVIINTRAGIDHDCRVGAHAHVSIGATIAGGVIVGEGSHVGAGSVIIEGVSVGKGCVVGAGAVVIRNVADGETVVGVPAKRIQR